MPAGDQMPQSPMSRLGALWRPRSVAVVGASPRSAMSARLLRCLDRFGPGTDVFLINPRYTEIDDMPCYPSLGDADRPVDLVVVLVPAGSVVEVLDEAAAAGAQTVVVLSSGFAETGPAGAHQQELLAKRAREHGLRLLGPNCQGLFHRGNGLGATFTGAIDLDSPPDTGIAYVGQSGALGGSLLGLAHDRGIGLTAWASVGNQADITSTELVSSLLDDPTVRVVTTYVESLPHGREWAEVTGKAHELGKGIVVLRGGRSQAGRAAAASHTGAMVTDGTAFDLLSADNGAVLVDELDELLDVATALGRPHGPSRRVAVVTSSGGAGSLALDHIDQAGLELAELAPETSEAIAGLVPDFGTSQNPVDVTAQVINDSSSLARVVSLVAADPGVDAVLLSLTSIGGEQAQHIANSLAQARHESPTAQRKPHVVTWLYSAEATSQARRRLREAGFCVHDTLSRSVSLLRRLDTASSAIRHRPPVEHGVWAAEQDLLLPRTESEGRQFLEQAAIPTPPGKLARSSTEAARIAEQLQGPVVLKIQSPQITHKSDVGGVEVGLSDSEVAAVFDRIVSAVARYAPDAPVDGVLVQQLARPGWELILGAQAAHDGYPPLLTVGFGGLTTELHQDVTTALAPVTEQDAEGMLRRLRSWPLLTGYRNHLAADVPAACAAIARLSRVCVALGDRFDALEINPLIVHEGTGGVTAVDLVVHARGFVGQEAGA